MPFRTRLENIAQWMGRIISGYTPLCVSNVWPSDPVYHHSSMNFGTVFCKAAVFFHLPDCAWFVNELIKWLISCLCYFVKNIINYDWMINWLSATTLLCALGPLLGFPIVDAYVQLHDFRVGDGTSVPMIGACTAQCLFQAAMKATPILLEPVMALEVSAYIYYNHCLFDYF